MGLTADYTVHKKRLVTWRHNNRKYPKLNIEKHWKQISRHLRLVEQLQAAKYKWYEYLRSWRSKDKRGNRKRFLRYHGWTFFKFDESYKQIDPSSSMSPKYRNKKQTTPRYTMIKLFKSSNKKGKS